MRASQGTRNFQRWGGVGGALSHPVSRRPPRTHAERGRAPPRTSPRGGPAVLPTANRPMPGQPGWRGRQQSRTSRPRRRGASPSRSAPPGSRPPRTPPRQPAARPRPLPLRLPRARGRAPFTGQATPKTSSAIMAKPAHLTRPLCFTLRRVRPAATRPEPRLPGLSFPQGPARPRPARPAPPPERAQKGRCKAPSPRRSRRGN